MKTLYLDCSMGAAGDMLTAALLELTADSDLFVDKLNGLKIPGVEYRKETVVKSGIQGTYMKVMVHGAEEGDVEHRHSHFSMQDIKSVTEQLPVSDKVRRDIIAVYEIIAEAEGRVHGVPVEQIHFHEVGNLDAIADVTAVCMLMEELAPEKIMASDVHVGCGQVRCAHGILPVPAPATAEILKGVPIYGGRIKGELCTPTGAALLKYFVTQFGDMPVMTPEAIGYGMGKKDFEQANCVRAILGETLGKRDAVYELECNVDDMTAEAMGFAMEQILSAGAKDVFVVPVTMKKSRPGMLLKVLCAEEDRRQMAEVIFTYTTTIGIRETLCERYVLERSFSRIMTPWGEVQCKTSSGYGVTRRKLEYEDLAEIAREQGLNLEQVRKKAEEAFDTGEKI